MPNYCRMIESELKAEAVRLTQLERVTTNHDARGVMEGDTTRLYAEFERRGRLDLWTEAMEVVARCRLVKTKCSGRHHGARAKKGE